MAITARKDTAIPFSASMNESIRTIRKELQNLRSLAIGHAMPSDFITILHEAITCYHSDLFLDDAEHARMAMAEIIERVYLED